jgi:hypothetical protein
LSRTHRLFQAVYLPLWYTIINGIAIGDFMGAVREHGQPAGPHPVVVLGAALLMLGLVFGAGAARRSRRF